MDAISGLVDKSTDFASYLTVSRKFQYRCIDIFHIIYPEKSIWKLILWQTKIFNIFPGSIEQSSNLKFLSAIVSETQSAIFQKTHCRFINQNRPVRFK